MKNIRFNGNMTFKGSPNSKSYVTLYLDTLKQPENAGKVLGFDDNGNIVANDAININDEGSISTAGSVYAEGNVTTDSDVYVGNEDSSNAIHLYSPNGTEYAVTVDDSGNLVVTQVV